MAKIKTKDAVKGTIKQLDKTAMVSDRMRTAYISTKDKAENSVNAAERNPEEYASDRIGNTIDRATHEAAHQADNVGRWGVRTTKDNISQGKDALQNFKEKRTAENIRKQSQPYRSPTGRGSIHTAEHTEKTIKQSVTSSGKRTIKTAEKTATKTAQKSVKTAERTSKAAIKTAQQTARTAQETAQAAVKTSQKAAQAAKATAKAVATGAKAALRATIAAVKAAIAGIKALVAAVAAGGWIAVIVIIAICLIGLICGSVFGVFFSGEDSGTGQTMRTAVVEINTDYDNKLDELQNSVTYDMLEMSGSRAVWKDVLAVYSVKVNTDQDNPLEVATMDDTKKQLLKNIFWEMNSIDSRTETHTETEITEIDDGHGNIIETETTVTKTTLYITVSHKTVDEMADQYGFNDEQKQYLTELLADENASLWSNVLYGISTSDDAIVAVALSQIGNVGGEPYWSWYGFDGRVEWCACFVSWCANECGYIDAGIIPKYAGCVNGVQWFKGRGQWMDNSAEPAPGTIIFFDWDSPNGSSGPQDGESDHTGIVEKVENGRVYTIEGNSGDRCRQKSYPVGYYEILGYGCPAY